MTTKPRPRLGVAVLVKDARGRLLLGKRGKRPNLGKWIIPGGGVEFGETLHEAARREILEETGISILIMGSQHPSIVEIIEDDEHRVIMVLHAIPTSHGKPKADSDLLDVDFFQRCEITNLTLSPVVVPVLRETGWLPPE